MRIGLIGCTNEKLPNPAPARQLFSPSFLFRAPLRLLDGRADPVYVLSAHYGLLPLDQVVEPYRGRLDHLGQRQRLRWAVDVAAAIQGRHGQTLEGITFEIHASEHHRDPLESMLEAVGAVCFCPVDGMTMGQRLAFYDALLPVDRRTGPAGTADLSVMRSPVYPVIQPLEGQVLRTVKGALFRVVAAEHNGIVIAPVKSGATYLITWRKMESLHARLISQRMLSTANAGGSLSNYAIAMLATLPDTWVERGRSPVLHLR